MVYLLHDASATVTVLAYKTKPYPHQVRALRTLLRNGGGGLQVPMRWGKSWVGINYAAALYQKGDIKRVLIVTVTSGLGVWEGQIEQHCPVPWIAYVHGCADEDEHSNFSKWDDVPCLSFWIVNFQNLYTRVKDRHSKSWVATPNSKLIDWNAGLMIVDESHHIGNPSALQSKEAHRLGRRADFRVFMTGSMFHRKPFYVFGQAKFYDDGAALGSSFTHYKKRIAVFGGYGGYEVLRYRNLRWMTRRIKPFVYMEDYVPPRDAVNNTLSFRLTGRTLQVYEKMRDEGAVTLGTETALAPIVLTQHLRLQQICGGFLRTDKGTKKIGSDKLQICADRLREYLEQGIEKAVVGCRFLPELVAITRLAKEVGFHPILLHGSVPKSRRRERIEQFARERRPCLFISQIAAGKESIDLSAASVMMFYSLSESYVEHDQFSKRIEKYNEKRTLMYDYVEATGTRDEVTRAALELKQDVASFIVSNPEKVEEMDTLKNRKRASR